MVLVVVVGVPRVPGLPHNLSQLRVVVVPFLGAEDLEVRAAAFQVSSGVSRVREMIGEPLTPTMPRASRAFQKK